MMVEHSLLRAVISLSVKSPRNPYTLELEGYQTNSQLYHGGRGPKSSLATGHFGTCIFVK